MYGPAAADVKTFYGLIEQAFLASPGNSRYSDKALSNWKNVVYANGLVEPCRQALERAGQQALRPDQMRMLSALHDEFEKNIGRVSNMRVFGLKVANPPQFDPDFASVPWSQAKVADDFVLEPGQKPYEQRTEVRLLYDDERLYFGIRCYHPDPAGMIYRREFASGNRFPQGEGFEIFLQGDWAGQRTPFVQMVIDPAGNRYAGARAGQAWQAESCVTADGWSAMISLTWAEARLTPQPGMTLRGAFIRQIKASEREGIAPLQHVALFGSARHHPEGFCDIVLEK